jgi:pantothenate kinase
MVEATAPASLPDVVDGLRRRHDVSGARQIVGIVGPPGTGKSTLAQHVADLLGRDVSVIVPMDGFHLATVVLAGTPLAARKGAPDTFDVHGYLSLLRRLRARDEPVVYAPAFRRHLEEPVAGSIPVPAAVPFVISEGNYLLADREPWHMVREYLDEAWFVDTPHDLRLSRLVERHMAFGKDAVAARAWASGPDEENARYVETTRARADRVVRWD